MPRCLLAWWNSGQDPDYPLETVVLEKTLIKLGQLLALGAGPGTLRGPPDLKCVN